MIKSIRNVHELLNFEYLEEKMADEPRSVLMPFIEKIMYIEHIVLIIPQREGVCFWSVLEYLEKEEL